MVDAKVLETVNFFGAQLRNNGVRINNLILFGSSSADTATTGSDIDIAIVSDDFVNRDIFDRALLTKDAEMLTVKKFKVPLDVITLTQREYEDQKSLIAGTIRKGITLPTVSLA
jgi:predicted nucleotidyltransferase